MDKQKSQPLFPLFSRLPAELRMMIWEDSIEPRIVRVNILSHSSSDFWSVTYKRTVSWRVTRIPTLLEVSVEARQVGLRQYEMLRCVYPVTVARGKPMAIVYFHPRMDVLGQDFQAVPMNSQTAYVRPPGCDWDPLPVEFFNIFRGQRPLTDDSFDVFHQLRHIHLDLFILRESGDLGIEKMWSFINSLLKDQAPDVLKTVTLRIMDAARSPTDPWSSYNKQSSMYRIVRRPTLPIPNPKEFFSGCVTREYCAKLSYTDILARDGAIFTRPVMSDFAVLRVIDPAANGAPVHVQEATYWAILAEGEEKRQLPNLIDWLLDLLDTARSPLPESPWGICGVNYGMEDAKVYPKIRAPVEWPLLY
ncbi:uncharacterized protein B0H64DRAFT_436250 [Chaetomium fimeti]|uniref:2EXR domain-containing protein n=1 Tax=Chaetomium fimeti TaxID=1854472 RepID=A0AAE0H6G5_9PEZI|nr:hypothetical protein B0H64DRAFT_436250 [Chaetomium fimeti]